jgi:hypothetical protein
MASAPKSTLVLQKDETDQRKIIFAINQLAGRVNQQLTGFPMLVPPQLYVDPVNGNDANNGTSTVTAFKTIQAAVNLIQTQYFITTSNVIISVSGNVTESVVVQTTAGPGQIIISGTNTTSTPWTWTAAAGLTYTLVVSTQARAIVQNFQFIGQGLVAQLLGVLTVATNINFGNCAGGIHMAANGGFIVASASNYTISGGAAFHIFVSALSNLLCQANTINLVGSPVFSNAFVVASGSQVHFESTTFPGGAVGTAAAQYIIQAGGAIFNSTVLPGNPTGNSGGTTTGGGYAL